MGEKNIKAKSMVFLGYFESTPLYYDNQSHALWFSTARKANSKLIERAVFLSTLLFLPVIRVFNGHTLFENAILNAFILLLFSAISIVFGVIINNNQRKKTEFYPAYLSKNELLAFLDEQTKDTNIAISTLVGSVLGTLLSLIFYLINANFLSLLIYAILLFVVYLCLVNNVHKRKYTIQKLIKDNGI